MVKWVLCYEAQGNFQERQAWVHCERIEKQTNFKLDILARGNHSKLPSATYTKACLKSKAYT